MSKAPNLNAVRERIRQVKVELARLKMLEKLALMESRSTTGRTPLQAKGGRYV